MSIEPGKVTDEDLTAFLDGELPPEDAARLDALIAADADLAARLAFLARAGLPYADAFAPLIAAAPSEAMEARFAAIAQPAPSGRGWLTRRTLVGAMAASLVAGILADRAFTHLLARRQDEEADWREAVAGYMALYTRDTLAGPAPSAQQQQAELALIDARIGLALSPQAVAVPLVAYKRAVVLDYEGQPLAQIAYLDPESGPMALCVLRSTRGPHPPEMERRSGLNLVYWRTAQHAFMLIGRAGAERLQRLAAGLAQQIAV